MPDHDLARLRALADEGDPDAASALLREARRRADTPLIEHARGVLLAGSVGLGDWLETHTLKRLPASAVRRLLCEALGKLAEHHDNDQAGHVWNLNALRVAPKPPAPSGPTLIALQPEGGGWLEIQPYDLSSICLPHIRPQGLVALGPNAHYLPDYLRHLSPAPAHIFWDNMANFAPEILCGRRRTIRTDLHAVAVIGYVLWTGDLPFFDNHPHGVDLFRHILRGSPPKHLAGDIPTDPDAERLHRVIEYVLKKNAFSSALDMQKAFSSEPLPNPIPTPTLGDNKPKGFWARLRSGLKRG